MKEETEKKKKKDEAEAAEKVAKAEEERRQAKRHDGADVQRKLSVSNITRVGQRLVDHYQVEKQQSDGWSQTKSRFQDRDETNWRG